MVFLAQTPDEAIGWAKKLNDGGVPVIALFFTLLFAGVIAYLFRLLLKKEERNTSIELAHRTTVETKALADQTAAEKRLLEAKTEASTNLRERLATQKDSDETLGHAVQVLERVAVVLERATVVLERIDRKGG